MDKTLRLLSLFCLLCAFGANAQVSSTPHDQCSSAQPSECVDGVSSTVTGFDSLRVALAQQLGSPEERQGEEQSASTSPWALVSRLLDGGHSGGIGIWAAAARSEFDSNVPSTQGRILYTGELTSAALGLDRQFGEAGGLLGLSVGLEQRDTETEYNGGGESSDGTSVQAFLIWPLNARLSTGLVASYASLSTDQERIDPADGQTLRASFDSSRWAAIANMQFQDYAGSWSMAGHWGLLYAAEDADGYTESAGSSTRTVRDKTVELTQAFIGGELSYLFASQDVYAFAAYRYDLSSDSGNSAGGLPGSVGNVQPDDDDELELGAGWRFFTGGGFNGSLEYLQTLDRARFDNQSLALLLRQEF